MISEQMSEKATAERDHVEGVFQQKDPRKVIYANTDAPPSFVKVLGSFR